MKHFALAAGVALLAFSTPSLAKSEKGHGNDKHNSSATKHDGHGKYKTKGHAYKAKGGSKVSYYGYGRGGCPPGLAKKNDGCMPRGQFRKRYSQGQRYPGSYGSLWSYNQIPYDLRTRYDFDRSNRYYYSDGYLYQVDPRSRMIEQVVNAIVR